MYFFAFFWLFSFIPVILWKNVAPQMFLPGSIFLLSLAVAGSAFSFVSVLASDETIRNFYLWMSNVLSEGISLLLVISWNLDLELYWSSSRHCFIFRYIFASYQFPFACGLYRTSLFYTDYIDILKNFLTIIRLKTSAYLFDFC